MQWSGLEQNGIGRKKQREEKYTGYIWRDSCEWELNRRAEIKVDDMESNTAWRKVGGHKVEYVITPLEKKMNQIHLCALDQQLGGGQKQDD